METKWTPGPWRYNSVDGAVYFADGDVEPLVATVCFENTSDTHAAADGSLIAAAPELYEALADLIAANKKARSFQNVKAQAEAALNQKSAERVALAVLAKARGEA